VAHEYRSNRGIRRRDRRFFDLVAIPSGTRTFRTALLHAALNLTVSGAYIANFAWRHADYERSEAVGFGPLVLSVVSLVALAVSGWLGGRLAYRYGVRVAREADQIHGFQS
jgi:uncharacterized membrane protein